MKRIILIILVGAIPLQYVQAEEFVIEQQFHEDVTDVSGSDPSNPKDANFIETAIVKVQSTMNDLVFVSDYIIEERGYTHGQYVFFMAEGARSLQIRKKDGTILPITIKFSDNGIKKLKRKCCYKMTISGKDVKYYGTLIVNFGPQGAVLTCNDQTFSSGNFSQLLEVGRYTISVEKAGYGTYNEVVDIVRDSTIQRTVNLKQTQANLSIVTDELSDIYLDGEKVGRHTYDAAVSIGQHRIKIMHGNHKEEHVINVTSAGATFKKEILGSLKELYDKSNQTFQSGYDHLIPRKNNDMEERTAYSDLTTSLLGHYKVVFSRPEYWSRSKNVYIEPVHTTIVHAPKLYKKRAWTFLSYQYSPKADVGLMLGVCGKIGGYVSGRYNIGIPIFQGNMKPRASNNTFGINSWAVDGGLMFRLCQELYVYAGAGYCTYESGGTRFKQSNELSGANVEAGIILNLHGKTGKGFTITGGYNTLLDANYWDVMDPVANIVVGIGFVL